MLCPNDVIAPLQSGPPFPATIVFFRVTVPATRLIPPTPIPATLPAIVLFTTVSNGATPSILAPAPAKLALFPLTVVFVSDTLPPSL